MKTRLLNKAAPFICRGSSCLLAGRLAGMIYLCECGSKPTLMWSFTLQSCGIMKIRHLQITEMKEYIENASIISVNNDGNTQLHILV